MGVISGSNNLLFKNKGLLKRNLPKDSFTRFKLSDKRKPLRPGSHEDSKTWYWCRFQWPNILTFVIEKARKS
jgi:hypothetical protein